MTINIPLAVCSLALAMPHVAFAEQSFPLTPKTLDTWTVTGAEQGDLTSEGSVVLPAGAQLSRDFESGNVAVNLDAKLAFSADPANWVVLEIGSAALTFVRNGDQGNMKLIVGTQSPITLPFGFILDEGGVSIDRVRITFARVGGLIAVNAQGQTVTFPNEPIAESSANVVVSAGGTSSLSFTSFEVVVGAIETPGDDASKDPATSNSSADSKNSAPGNAASNTGFFAPPVVKTTNVNVQSKEADPKTQANVRKVGLVVFSASAFRHGRADSIRASASTSAAGQK